MPRKGNPSDKVLTVTPEGSREYTNLGRKATYRKLASGEIPHIKNGNRYVIPIPALLRWLKGALTACREETDWSDRSDAGVHAAGEVHPVRRPGKKPMSRITLSESESAGI